MYMMYSVLGAVLIGGLTGFASEKIGFTAKGMVPAVIIGVGGGAIAYMLMALTGIGLGGRTMTAIIGAAAALYLTPKIGGR